MYIERSVLLATGIHIDTERSTENSYYFTLTCAAYGDPVPNIAWSAIQNDNKYSIESDPNFFIFFSEVVIDLERYSSTYVVSILQACAISTDSISGIECTTENNVCTNNSLGYQRARFDLNSELHTSVHTTEV